MSISIELALHFKNVNQAYQCTNVSPEINNHDDDSSDSWSVESEIDDFLGPIIRLTPEEIYEIVYYMSCYQHLTSVIK